MTNDRSGLRFDIYERVHVADELAGIKELDEIELVPHIRVNVEGDQAVLKGNLWLTGTYSGEADEGRQTLEHLIPVEITMPLSRIGRLDEIAVEIENFDVDLLSSRSLNVTGVLSLCGIEMRSTEDEMPAAMAEEEEMVFIHEASARSEQDEADQAAQTRQQQDAPAQQDQQEPQQAEFRQAEEGQLAEPDSVRAQRDRIYPEEVGIPEFMNEGQELPVFENDVVEEGEDVLPVSAQESDKTDNAAPLAEPAQEEKKETKLVFGSKKEEQQAPVSQNKLLSALFGQREFRSDASSAQQIYAEEDKSEAGRQDQVEWKKLFLSGDNRERESFRRMRVCIVQKEETMETIAQRYKINPREIALYNRLSDQQVIEGQVIYIPQK